MHRAVNADTTAAPCQPDRLVVASLVQGHKGDVVRAERHIVLHSVEGTHPARVRTGHAGPRPEQRHDDDTLESAPLLHDDAPIRCRSIRRVLFQPAGVNVMTLAVSRASEPCLDRPRSPPNRFLSKQESVSD